MMTEIFFCENWLIWLYEKACFTPIAPRFETICTWFGFLESQKKKKKKKKWTAFLWFPVTFVALKFLILSMRNTFAEKIEILGIDTAKWRKAKFCVL